MNVTPEAGPPTIAGHAVALRDRAGGMLNLQIALHGASLVALARTLATLDGVRVTRGPDGASPGRCYVVHCLGFKMVLCAPDEKTADFAQALVSRTPQTTLAIMSELAGILEGLMSEPPPVIELAISRTAFQKGKPLARRTQLRRRTPLSRGRF